MVGLSVIWKQETEEWTARRLRTGLWWFALTPLIPPGLAARLVTAACVALAVMSLAPPSAAVEDMPRLDFLVYVDGSTPLLRGGADAPIVRIANGLETIFTRPLAASNRNLLGPDDGVTIKLLTDVTETLISASGRDVGHWTKALAKLRVRAGARGSMTTDFNQILQLVAEDIRASQRRHRVTVVLLASDFIHDEWNATVPFCEARELYRNDETAPVAPGLAALRPLIEGSQTATVFLVLIDVSPEEDYIRRLSDGYERCYRNTLDARYIQTLIEAMDPDATVIDLDHLKAWVADADLGFTSAHLNEIGPDFSILHAIGQRRGGQFDLTIRVRNNGVIEGRIDRLYVFESPTAASTLAEIPLAPPTAVSSGQVIVQITVPVQPPMAESLAEAGALHLSVTPNGPRERVDVITATATE